MVFSAYVVPLKVVSKSFKGKDGKEVNFSRLACLDCDNSNYYQFALHRDAIDAVNAACGSGSSVLLDFDISQFSGKTRVRVIGVSDV